MRTPKSPPCARERRRQEEVDVEARELARGHGQILCAAAKAARPVPCRIGSSCLYGAELHAPRTRRRLGNLTQDLRLLGSRDGHTRCLGREIEGALNPIGNDSMVDHHHVEQFPVVRAVQSQVRCGAPNSPTTGSSLPVLGPHQPASHSLPFASSSSPSVDDVGGPRGRPQNPSFCCRLCRANASRLRSVVPTSRP